MDKEKMKKFMYHVMQIFVPLALAIAFYFILLRFSSIATGFEKFRMILAPFIYGGVMAYLLKTPCNFFDRFYQKRLPKKYKKHYSGLSVLTVLIISFVVIYWLFRLVIPQVVKSIISLSYTLPGQINRFFNFLSGFLKKDGVVQNYVRPFTEEMSTKIAAWSKSDLIPTLQNMMGGFTDTLAVIFDVLYNLIIGLVICIYSLCARKTFSRQAKAVLYAVIPSRYADKVMDEVRFIDETFEGFLGGKILDSAIVGLICYAFCVVMALTRGLKNGILISLIIGVTNIIPYFGPFIGAIPCAFLVLMQDSLNAVIFIIFVILLQQVDGNILGPKLLAGSVGLSGFWVLFAITLFGGMYGFAGILVGVPVFAVIYDLLKKLVKRGLKRNNSLELLSKSAEELREEVSVKKKKRTKKENV